MKPGHSYHIVVYKLGSGRASAIAFGKYIQTGSTELGCVSIRRSVSLHSVLGDISMIEFQFSKPDAAGQIIVTSSIEMRQ